MSRPRPLTEEALSRQYLREHPTPSSRLAEHAETIRKIGKRVTRDIIKIGRILTEAKALTGHGGWLPWLKEEFGWSEMSALNFMRVYEMAKTKNFLDLNLPVSTLYLLARPNTPPKVIETVVERSEEGEQFTTVDIKRLIHEAKPPVFVPATAAPRMPDKSKPPVEVTRMITKPSPEPVMAADILTSCELMSVLPPKIGEDLAMRLRGHRATLFSWTQQHKDAGIPDVLAAFNAAIDAIDELLDYKRKETKMMIIALLFLSDTLFTLSWTYAAASDACIFRVRLSGRLGGGQRACDDHLSGQAGPGLNDQWNALDFVCRAEPGGSEASDLACEQRSALDKILEKKGCRNIYPATGLTIRLIGNAGR